MITILVAAWGISPALSFVACWGPHSLAPASPLEPRRDVTVHAFAGLARKIKEKEVSALRVSAPAEWFQARGKHPPSRAVEESLRKRPGTVSLVAECRRKGQRPDWTHQNLKNSFFCFSFFPLWFFDNPCSYFISSKKTAPIFLFN